MDLQVEHRQEVAAAELSRIVDISRQPVALPPDGLVMSAQLMNEEPDGQTLVLKQYVHIGVAVDTDRGLLVPVIRNADTKNLVQISVELSQLSEKASGKRIAGAGRIEHLFQRISRGGKNR